MSGQRENNIAMRIDDDRKEDKMAMRSDEGPDKRHGGDEKRRQAGEMEK